MEAILPIKDYLTCSLTLKLSYINKDFNYIHDKLYAKKMPLRTFIQQNVTFKKKYLNITLDAFHHIWK